MPNIYYPDGRYLVELSSPSGISILNKYGTNDFEQAKQKFDEWKDFADIGEHINLYKRGNRQSNWEIIKDYTKK